MSLGDGLGRRFGLWGCIALCSAVDINKLSKEAPGSQQLDRDLIYENIVCDALGLQNYMKYRGVRTFEVLI